MAYIPTSKNPHITTAMLQQALYMEYRSKKGIEILMQNEKNITLSTKKHITKILYLLKILCYTNVVAKTQKFL